IDLAAFRGRVVLLDFGSTANGPWRAELPGLRKLYDAYHGRGFEILTVTEDAEKAPFAALLKERSIPWPCLHDSPPAGQPSLAAYYAIGQLPAGILLDRAGRVVSLQARGEELRRLLERELGPVNVGQP